MLIILSKLSIIRNSNFGSRCFDTLKDLMIAGKDTEVRVTKVIKQEVVRKLQMYPNPDLVPTSLLHGLYDLMKHT
jgi:hypothetical protein